MNGSSLLIVGLIIIGIFVVWWFFIRDTINKDTTDYIELSSFIEQDGGLIDKINYYDHIELHNEQRILLPQNLSGFTDFDNALRTLHLQDRINKLQFSNAHTQKITKGLIL